MKRRDILHYLTFTGVLSLCGCSRFPLRYFSSPDEGSQDIGEVLTPAKPPALSDPVSPETLNDVRTKSVHFLRDFPDDLHFAGRKYELVESLLAKFRLAQKRVGHGNFNLMGMDEFFRTVNSAPGVNEVSAEEKQFLEEIFFFEAKQYGFQGDKVVQKFTDAVDRRTVEKIPYTGHFLRKGKPIEIYEKIRKDVGDSVFLTSGVRALAKQYHLFFEKAVETKGNMSKASRSLAPPGYSFHGQGDFDVGRRGFGVRNFTDEFAATEEYKRLVGLGYIKIRYTERNQLGVRFEPWHIMVHPEA